jgi:hypothetical protein
MESNLLYVSESLSMFFCLSMMETYCILILSWASRLAWKRDD